MSSLKTGFFLIFVAWGCLSQAATISKLSVGINDESNGISINPSISADGRYVVFESDATNLVSNDTNDATDIFLVDTETRVIERVSIGINYTEANGGSTNPVISADGRYITFESFASNLVTNDSNNVIDIFVYDRVALTTLRASVNSAGQQATSHSFSPSISENGQFVAYYSLATNLVGSDTNRAIDVFVHDTVAGSTVRVSVDSNGNQGNMDSWQPRISANGQFVTFSSNASNLVQNDSNGIQDIFLHDRQTGAITLASIAPGGQPSNGRNSYSAVSGDGNFVVFESIATNLILNDNNGESDIFVYDKNLGTVSRVSQSTTGGDTDGPSYQPAISQNGRFISFFTYASNLDVANSNQLEDVYIYDQQNGTTELLTNTQDGQPSNNSTFNPSLNANGQFVVAFSLASNFVTPDTNNLDDVFLFDRGVLNNPPVADAGNDTSVVLGQSVTLDGTGSFDPDGTPISLYQWQVVSTPENSALAGWTSSEAAPTFIPDMTGVFVLSLIVNDGLVSSSADEVFVTVTENLPPVARITADTTEGYAPLTVSFNGSESYDPESGPISWSWDFGDGSSSAEMNPVHVYNNAGTYITVLTVTDNLDNQGQAEIVINVLAVNQPPEIVNLTVSPTTGIAPLTTNLSIDVIDPDNDNLSIVWETGDGTVVYDVLTLTHTYLEPGDYHGLVTVSDGISSTQQSFVVSVNSDFTINNTHYKLNVHKYKPQRNKFRFGTQFEFSGLPAPDDIIALHFGNLDIFKTHFHDFKAVQSGVYVHKNRQLMVELDFNRQKMKVYKQRVFINEDNFKPFAGIILTFGDHAAVGEIKLTEYKRCRKHQSLDQGEKECSVTILKNTQ
ncbi:PKD domain-containing protein [Kaarinaea lacus]